MLARRLLAAFLFILALAGAGEATAQSFVPSLIGTGSSGPVMRTINIASGMRGPGCCGAQSSPTSDGVVTAGNSTRWVRNESGVTVYDVSPMYSGWWTDSDSNGAENAASGNFTLTCSIEYPAGTRNQCTFDGTAAISGTVAPGANYTGAKAHIAGGIPPGGFFAVRSFYTVASGVKWPIVTAFQIDIGSTAVQDHAETGAAGTLTDKTTGTGNPGTGASGYFPTAILATGTGFKANVYAASGDSITNGTGDSRIDAYGNTSYMGRAASGQGPYMNFGVPGTTAKASAVSGMFSYRLDAMVKAGVTHLFLLYGTNDINLHYTGPTAISYLQTIAAQASARGIKVIGHTLFPLVGTSDQTQTIINQNVSGSFAGGASSDRAIFNAAMRAKPTGFYDYFEVADLVDANSANVLTRNGGFWQVGDGVNTSSPYLDHPYSGQASGAPTTTSIPTNIAQASTTNYFNAANNGRAVFTSGSASPSTFSIASNSGGTIVPTAALTTAPAANDNVILYNIRVQPTGDGIHPINADSTVTAPKGSLYIVRDAIAAKIGTF